MSATNFLLVLMLILAASACTPLNLPGQAADDSTLVEVSDQVADGSTPMDTPGQTVTATAPVDTPEPVVTVTVPVDTPEPVSSDDARQIYATAVRQVYTVDHSFGGDPPDFPFVYIVTTTDDGSLLDAPATPPQKLSAELQQAIEAGLTDLPFEIVWVESLDDVPVDPNNGAIAGGQGIVITLGNILPQNDGSVQLPFYMVCGGLCALGKTYVLNQIDGVWQVTGSVGVEIMA
jgi:hypothetical protein